jgi:hypothetical protein
MAPPCPGSSGGAFEEEPTDPLSSLGQTVRMGQACLGPPHQRPFCPTLANPPRCSLSVRQPAAHRCRFNRRQSKGKSDGDIDSPDYWFLLLFSFSSLLPRKKNLATRNILTTSKQHKNDSRRSTWSFVWQFTNNVLLYICMIQPQILATNLFVLIH